MSFKTLLPHLREFRKRLIRSTGVVLGLFIILLFFSQELFDLIAQPLLQQSGQMTLIATHVTTPFTTPLKLAFFAAMILASPFLLYQGWAFIAPGLYPTEKRMLRPILAASCTLFFAGMGFAYFLVCPMTLRFFQKITPASVTMMTDMHYYLDFVLALTLSFGLCFQVPLITYLLLKSQLLTVAQLRRKRPHIIVGAFTVGMVLTPPDVISQVMLALPLWALFEVGTLFYQWQTRQKPSYHIEA